MDPSPPPSLVVEDDGRNRMSDLDMVAGSSMLPGIGLLRSGAVLVANADAAAAAEEVELRGDDDVLYPPLREELLLLLLGGLIKMVLLLDADDACCLPLPLMLSFHSSPTSLSSSCG